MAVSKVRYKVALLRSLEMPNGTEIFNQYISPYVALGVDTTRVSTSSMLAVSMHMYRCINAVHSGV
jgi:hypothetical protein